LDIGGSKEEEIVLECIENALDGLENVASVLGLVQLYMIVAPIGKIHQVMGHREGDRGIGGCRWWVEVVYGEWDV
jgi:hypothetical protein